MSIDEFFNNYNGKSVDWDGKYGAQCVDLVAYYCRDVFGIAPMYADAHNWFHNFSGQVANRFNRITNNPNDYNQIPKRGDIIIWSGDMPGSGKAGHIAVYDAKIAPGQFRSFDQNYGGMYAHFVSHNYNYILGWLTPKSAQPVPQEGDDVALTKQLIVDEYLVNRGSAPNDSEVAHHMAHGSLKALSLGFRNENDTRRVGTTEQLQAMQNNIDHSNRAITSLTSENKLSKVEQAKLIAEIADSNADLATARDTIVDLQNRKPETIEVIKEPSWLIKVREFINNFLKRS